MKMTLERLRGRLQGSCRTKADSDTPRRSSSRIATRQANDQYWLEHNFGGGVLTSLQLELASNRQAGKILEEEVTNDQDGVAEEEETTERATAGEMRGVGKAKKAMLARSAEPPKKKGATRRRENSSDEKRSGEMRRSGDRAHSAFRASLFPQVRLHRMSSPGRRERRTTPIVRLARQPRTQAESPLPQERPLSPPCALTSESPVPSTVVCEGVLIDQESCNFPDSPEPESLMEHHPAEMRPDESSRKRPHEEVGEDAAFVERPSKRVASLNARYYMQIMTDQLVLAQLLFGTPPPGKAEGEAKDEASGVSGSRVEDKKEEEKCESVDEEREGENIEDDDVFSKALAPPPPPPPRSGEKRPGHHSRKMSRELLGLLENSKDFGKPAARGRLRQTLEREKFAGVESPAQSVSTPRGITQASQALYCARPVKTKRKKPLAEHLRRSDGGWVGNGYLHTVLGANGQCRHFFDRVNRSEESINVGDKVLFQLPPFGGQPRVGRVQSVWCEEKVVGLYATVQEYVRPENTAMGRRPCDGEMEVFATHLDRNVEFDCVLKRCYVTTFAEYCRYRAEAKRLAEGRHVLARPAVPKSVSSLQVAKDLDTLVDGSISSSQVFFCRYNYDHRLGRLRLRAESYAHHYSRVKTGKQT